MLLIQITKLSNKMVAEFMSDCLIFFVEKYMFSTISNEHVFLFKKIEKGNFEVCVTLHLSLNCTCLKLMKLTSHIWPILTGKQNILLKLTSFIQLYIKYINKTIIIRGTN
jgi:hypothetical protein